jgi:hypothetical protein
MSCQSIDNELLRADSWSKLKKATDKWKIPNDVWTDIQKGMQHYMQHPENVTLRTCHKSPPHHFHIPSIASEIELRWHLGCSLTSGGKTSQKFVYRENGRT